MLRFRARRHPLRSIRESMTALGVPVGHLADEESEERVMRFGKAMAKAGIPAREAEERLGRTIRAMACAL